MSSEDIIQTYGKRWNIEQMFHTQKQLLGLVSKCQAKKYNAIIAHATIVCICNALLEYIRREETDDRTIGEVFRASCNELKDLSFDVALNRFFWLNSSSNSSNRFNNVSKAKGYEATKMLTKNRLSSWFQEQTQYIQNILKAMAKDAFP